MRKRPFILITILSLVSLSKPMFADVCDLRDSADGNLIHRRGVAAAHSSYDSMAMSMMLWGSGLAIAIAGLSVWLSEGAGVAGQNPNHATIPVVPPTR